MKNRSKGLVLGAFLAALIVNSNHALALEEKTSSVAILDVEEVIKNSSVMKDIQKKVSNKQKEFQKEIDKRQALLQEEDKKLTSKKNILSKEAFEKEQGIFEKKVADLKDFLDKRQNSLKKASLDAMGKVQERVKDIVSDISKERNFNLILPASQTVFYTTEIDISADVLRRLNEKIVKVDVKFD